MKTINLIKKLNKAGIEVKAIESRNNRYEGKTKSQVINFYDQDGEATCISCYDLSMTEEEKMNYSYQDCSYRTYFDTAKHLIEWVLRHDRELEEREAKKAVEVKEEKPRRLTVKITNICGNLYEARDYTQNLKDKFQGKTYMQIDFKCWPIGGSFNVGVTGWADSEEELKDMFMSLLLNQVAA